MSPIAIRLALLALFAVATVQVYVTLGDSPFTRILAGVVVAVIAATVGFWYVVLPLMAWRRARWSTESVDFSPVSAQTQWPDAVKARIAALGAAGFTPRLEHAFADTGATATMVYLAHRERDTYACVSHFTIGRATATSTRVMSRPGSTATCSVLDAITPSPFPPPPGHRMLLYPGADAATLVAHFERLRAPHETEPPLGDADLAAALARAYARRDEWLVDAGYLSRSVQEGARRYTLQGGFTAALRPQWPWHNLVSARSARDGRRALSSGS